MLLIGTRTNEPNKRVTIDLSGLLHHTLVVGQSGSGKSFFVARLVEEILTRTRARVVVIDPNGDFHASSRVSPDIWETEAERFSRLRQLSATAGIADLDDRDAFSEAWSLPRFVYLQADPRAAPSPVLHEGRTARRRLIIRWADLGEERDFLLQVDPQMHPNVALGLKACQDNLEWLQQSRPEHNHPNDLEGLAQIAEAFASRNIALNAYDYVKHCTAEDWSSVRARLFDLRKAYSLWWHQRGGRQIRPDSLTDYLDRPFRANAERSWDLLTLGLESASQADQLLSADVTLWRLWQNAKDTWRAQLHNDGTAGMSPPIPTFVVVDEAHNFAPRARSEDPLRRRVADRLIQIASEGRKYGLYLILATQRPTKLNLELVPECENSCVLRVQSSLEQEFASDVLGIPQDMARTTARFTQGQGLLTGRWMSEAGPIDAIAAPARVVVGGGGLDNSWKNPPDRSSQPDETDGLASQLRDYVRAELEAAPTPLTLVSLANSVMGAFPGAIGPDSHWLGVGSFKAVLNAVDISGLKFDSTPPGWAYLAGIHDLAAIPKQRSGAAVTDLAARIHEEVGVPLLDAAEFKAIYSVMAEIVNRDGYNLTSLTSQVRDRLNEQSIMVARAAVSFVAKGIGLAGHDWMSDAPQDAGTLARAFLRNVESLVAAANLDLDAEQRAELEQWIAGDTLLGEDEQ